MDRIEIDTEPMAFLDVRAHFRISLLLMLRPLRAGQCTVFVEETGKETSVYLWSMGIVDGDGGIVEGANEAFDQWDNLGAFLVGKEVNEFVPEEFEEECRCERGIDQVSVGGIS
jgi:hypothetical protein